jgi:hypothetical protein
MKAVALIKHRNLKQIRESVAQGQLSGEPTSEEFENLLTDLWEYYRFSCPKRNTIGAYMLGTLEPDWQQYVEFHLNTLGCRFCRANLDDLQNQSRETRQEAFQARIMESTSPQPAAIIPSHDRQRQGAGEDNNLSSKIL